MQSACAVLYCHLWRVRLYRIFPHYLINGTIFGKKLLNVKCVFWFSLQLSPETLLILSRIERHIVINVHRSSCKLPVILFRFWWNLNFLDRFSRNTQISWKSVFWEPGSYMQTDGRTDRQTGMMLIIAFCNLRTRLKTCQLRSTHILVGLCVDFWSENLKLGRPNCRREDCIEKNSREIWWECVGWIPATKADICVPVLYLWRA
jgi:hypothetical protein